MFFFKVNSKERIRREKKERGMGKEERKRLKTLFTGVKTLDTLTKLWKG